MAQYTPKTWTTGETITAAELNAIEQAAAAALPAADAATTYVAQSNAIDLEGVQDSVAGMFTGGTHSGISFAYDDPNGHINATVTGGGAGLPATVVSKTTAYTAAAGNFVQADATSAGFTVTLPTAPAVGALVAVKKVDASANVVTVAPAASGTIDGDANATIIAKGAGAVLEHVGSNAWQVTAVTSAAGPAGPAGATGATGPTGPGFVARGAWAPTTVYAVNDIVTNSGSTYRSLTAHTSGASFSGVGANWELWAAAGAQGTAGTGVPVGGTTGQVLAKTSNTDFATGWTTVSGGSVAVQDEGSALTARSTINFVGAGVTATDDAANSRTLVTIPGGGGGGVNPAVRDTLPTTTLTGAFAETFPRWLSSVSGVALGSGIPKLAAITLYSGETVSKALYVNGGTAITGGSHAWVALTDASGTVLAVSADDTAPTWAANTNKTFTLASSYSVTTTGLYYLALCVVATTAPGPMTAVPSGALATTPQPSISAVAPSGATTPPTVGASIGALTGQSSLLYAAVA